MVAPFEMPVSDPSIKPVLLLAGPTASGKSALACQLAERLHGVIINADSMQIYRGLAILTAQPTPAEQARIPHHLYGATDPAQPSSVADWRQAACAVIAAAQAAGHTAIVVGGTGLYLKALISGLAPVPAIPLDVATQVAALSTAELVAELGAADPDAPALPQDRQRLQRAVMVWRATGRPLRHWQALGGEPLPYPVHRVLLWPDRQVLYQRINQRFEQMLARGACDEVRRLLALGLDPRLPAMKAVGVPELSALLQGRLTETDAICRAQQHSRHYAKRQYTWFRHQMDWDQVLPVPDADAVEAAFTARAASAHG